MSDLIKRKDVLDAIEDFRHGIYNGNMNTDKDKESWYRAYKLAGLYDAVYKIPPIEEPKPSDDSDYLEATQEVHLHNWAGEIHVCSECGKIVPFIDWGQPYCSGCGSRFTNYEEFCRKDYACESCRYCRVTYYDKKRHYVCTNKESANYGNIEKMMKICNDVKKVE